MALSYKTYYDVKHIKDQVAEYRIKILDPYARNSQGFSLEEAETNLDIVFIKFDYSPFTSINQRGDLKEELIFLKEIELLISYRQLYSNKKEHDELQIILNRIESYKRSDYPIEFTFNINIGAKSIEHYNDVYVKSSNKDNRFEPEYYRHKILELCDNVIATLYNHMDKYIEMDKKLKQKKECA